MESELAVSMLNKRLNELLKLAYKIDIRDEKVKQKMEKILQHVQNPESYPTTEKSINKSLDKIEKLTDQNLEKRN